MSSARRTPSDIPPLLTERGPMTINEMADAMILHPETLKKWARMLAYDGLIHWCGHQVGREGSGTYPRLYDAGPAPFDELLPVPSTRKRREPRQRIDDDDAANDAALPIVPALHPIAAWGVAA